MFKINLNRDEKFLRNFKEYFTCGCNAKWGDHHSGVLLKQWSWSASPPKYIP